MNFFSKPRKVAQVYSDLRNKALSVRADQIGLKPDAANPIFGMLMETGYEDAVITLSAMGEGSVSLYFSNGGGIIGLGEHEGPRKAGLELLAFANQFLSHLRPTRDFPLPKTGNTTFYVLTINGVLTATAKEDDLGNKRLPLSPLFLKAHEVITEARLVDEQRQRNFQELMHAATTGDLDKIKFMIAKAVNIDVSDHEGTTPLMAASYSGHVEIMGLLLDAGVPIDAKDSSGYTALMFACNAGQQSTARYLVERGANIHETDKDGSTPIMFCAQQGHNDLVRFLLERGADPTQKGKHGLSAISFAQQNGLTETEKILRRTK